MARGRMAFDALGKIGNLIKGDLTKGQLAARLAPDVLIFAPMAAMQTPGDLGDKLIAGTASAIGGGLGGLATGGVIRKMGGNDAIQSIGDMAGSFGGDFAGMYAGDMVQRGKDLVTGGKGQTGWEKMGETQQAEYAADLEQQILRQYGIVPGTREQYAQADPNLMVRYADPATGMGVA